MPYLLRTIALAPVIVPQGIWTNLRVPTLPEPPGDRQGSVGDGPPLRVLIIGDSAAAGVGVSRQEDALLGQVVSRLAKQFRVEFDLQAKTGFTTADILRRLEEMEPGDSETWYRVPESPGSISWNSQIASTTARTFSSGTAPGTIT